MTLNELIRVARERGASDVHLEAGLPAALRVSSDLKILGEPLSADALVSMAHEVIDSDLWAEFVQRGSFDLSRVIEGVRCRINVLSAAALVSMAHEVIASDLWAEFVQR